MDLDHIVDLTEYPINGAEFRARCRQTLDDDGALIMPGFMQPGAVDQVRQEGLDHRDKAYFCAQRHSVYLSPTDPAYSDDHPRNRQVISTKGCITDDVVPAGSPLRTLYDSDAFKSFLCDVLGEEALYPYADPLSSINLHYANPGQELGWHFDNSSFAITLMIQPATAGGQFEYVENLRDADAGDMNFDGVADVLDGKVPVKQMSQGAGSLALFRGRNSIHRVAPVEGDTTRMLVVLAYNSAPGIALEENARMTFYGRLG